MTEVIKETVTTKGVMVEQPVAVATNSQMEASTTQMVEYLVYFFLGALEILLAFRVVFKFMGASTSSMFVEMIYRLTGLFIMPFEGIFSRAYNQGLETTSILEPSVLVGMIVYAVGAWGVVKLVRVLSGKQEVIN